MDYLEEVNFRTSDFGDFYDELPLWSAPFGLMLLEKVSLRRGMTILDVGAGTGFISIELSQRCGSEALIIAVDPWEAAMNRLARKANRLGLSNIRTMLQDVAAIDLPDASVDLIVSNLGLNNFDNPKSAVQSCFRIAKPGSRLFMTTNLVGHMSEFYDVYRNVLVDLGFSDRIAVLDAHINRRATVESVRVLLEQQGFEFVEAVTRSFQQRFIDGSSLLRHHFIRLGFVPAWKSIAPEGAVETTFAALEQRLNVIAAESGGLELTVPAACIEALKPA